MKALGVNLDSLGSQFEDAVPDRVLILDADGALYRASASSARLQTAIQRVQTEILQMMYLSKSEVCRAHLTHRDSTKNGRFNIKAYKPYQGTRTGKSKPTLLEPLREAMTLEENWLPEFSVTMNYSIEADDGCMIDSYRLKESGVLASEDKDLRMTPFPYFDRDTCTILRAEDGLGTVFTDYSDSGKKRLRGNGRAYFHAQCLTGDSADNIKGLSSYKGGLCGVATAMSIIGELKNESVMANAVIDCYREIEQNYLAEAYLLWMLRYEGDHVLNYLDELKLSKDNKAFLRECEQGYIGDTNDEEASTFPNEIVC